MSTNPSTVHHFLAFDFGAESGRAILARFDGQSLTLSETHRFANPNGRMNGSLQWDLLGQWENIKVGLRKACQSVDPSSIRSLGVCTWGVDFGLLGADGSILGNPVCYRDARTDGMLDEAFKLVPKRELFEITGIQFMQLNTLYQLLALSRANSSQLAGAETMLFVPDLFNYLLTGVARSELSIASTSQMLDARSGQWSIPLLRKIGIPEHILPPIIAPGTRLGRLREDVAAECGSPRIEVIAPCGHDTGSAVVAVPAGDANDWCYLSSGTWSLMGLELDQPVVSDLSFDLNYTNERGYGAGGSSSFRFLKNIMGLWLVQECRRAFESAGRSYDYATLTKLAADSEPCRTLIDPNHAPFGTPGKMPEKIADYARATQQPIPETDGAIVRACLDSLALEYARTLAGLERVAGRTLKTVHIVGGGTQNRLLNQLAADACNRTVITGPIEATALGNILVQMISCGVLPDLSAARRLIRTSFPVETFTPNPSSPIAWSMPRYLKIVAAA